MTCLQCREGSYSSRASSSGRLDPASGLVLSSLRPMQVQYDLRWGNGCRAPSWAHVLVDLRCYTHWTREPSDWTAA